MPRIHSVAVFLSSRFGDNPAWREAATALGAGLARAGIRVVYGAGGVGLMGVLADAALAAGGEVFGVIPDFLVRREAAHPGPIETVVTSTMHDRKLRMADAADAFVTMPGGIGTYDETIEVISWRQLGLHKKPILICDIAGSATPLLGLLRGAVAQGFAGPETDGFYEVHPSVDAVLARLAR